MIMPYMPESASEFAPQVDLLFLCLTVLCGGVGLLVVGLIATYAVRYRRGSTADRGHPIRRPWMLEIGWTLVPLGIFFALFVWSARLYVHLAHPPADAMPIYVIGKQWMWKFQHTNGQREIDVLHVPVGQAVVLILTSQDVIHDVFVPAFRIHHDVLPGQYTEEWFKATKPGRYHLFCSQYCGTAHAEMTGWVEAMTPEAFNRWLETSPPAEGLAKRGERLFVSLGCAGCHVGTSAVRAPSLEGLYGHMVPLSDGTFVLADDAYLRDSILQPAKQVAAGFRPLMPSFMGQVSEEDLFALVAYIKSLSDQTGRPQ